MPDRNYNHHSYLDDGFRFNPSSSTVQTCGTVEHLPIVQNLNTALDVAQLHSDISHLAVVKKHSITLNAAGEDYQSFQVDCKNPDQPIEDLFRDGQE